MPTEKNASTDMSYLDFQAYVDITKHIGGFAATDELLSLCHVAEAREVLYVGCGIGVGATYITRKYGCRVVGVDISEKMIAWARQRAREDKVENKTEFRVADVLDLPFEADRFDAVIIESVLAFVDDKPWALRECVRVTRPGGYVGLNESYWLTEPSPEIVAQVRVSVGSAIPTAVTWQALWEESGLHDRVVKLYQVDSRVEVRDRMRWVGWKWALRGFGRLFRLYITQPAARQLLREMFATPSLDTLRLMGYGLFVGRK
ncbi:MAG: class I SAM-dependent methyltransferase [Chloroflexi bacterium]|nr:class I SAM-dependent methyltransferase [Chloroflexota bacterium]